MYLVLKRFFLRTLGQHSTSFTIRHGHVAKKWPLSICKDVLFHWPRKKHPVDYNSPWKPFPLFVIWKSTTLARNSWRNERSKKNYKKFSHWQPSLFTLLRAVRRLNTKGSNSQSDKRLLCYLTQNDFWKSITASHILAGARRVGRGVAEERPRYEVPSKIL